MNDPSAIFGIIHSLVSQPESRLSVSEMCQQPVSPGAGIMHGLKPHLCVKRRKNRTERILTLFWKLISGAGIQKVQKEFT